MTKRGGLGKGEAQSDGDRRTGRKEAWGVLQEKLSGC